MTAFYKKPGSGLLDVGQLAAEMTEQLAPASEDVLAGWLEQIKEIATEAQTLADLQRRLLTAFSDLPEEALAEIMALVFSAARVAGMDDAVSSAEG